MNVLRAKVVKLSILFTLSVGLWACSSAPQQGQTSKRQDITIVEPKPVAKQSEIDRIKAEYLRTNDLQLRNKKLIMLADSEYKKENCEAAEVILQALHKTLYSTSNLAHANLIKIECTLLKYPQLDTLHPLLVKANSGASLSLVERWLTSAINVNSPELQARYAIAASSVHVIKQEYGHALNKVMALPNANAYLADAVFKDKIWAWFSLLDAQERKSIARRHPVLQEHLAILQIIEDNTLNDSIRQANVRQWLNQYSQRNFTINTPSQVDKYLADALALADNRQQKTVVLLPLSGRLSSQGMAIKQGILTAYLDQLQSLNGSVENTAPIIEFNDTGSLPTIGPGISAETLSQYDVVIGPLLKSHVEQLSGFVSDNQKHILLNTINDNKAKRRGDTNLHARFSLSPEQEAEQLARIIRARNVNQPVLISDASNVSNRLTEAFISAWQSFESIDSAEGDESVSTNNMPKALPLIRYTNNKSMRIGITSALDVLQSQRRIQQLSNLTQERVFSVTRNRRDVDAFIVFAKPEDLELINPIIESSISLFTEKQVPVFATSYSYNHKQNKNTQRDLRNLVFVDMPWLLPQGRDTLLAKQVDSLLNLPPSTFLRLFAFGYDALAISENLAQLSLFSHMSVKGLSGTLSVDEHNTIQRELSTISITED